VRLLPAACVLALVTSVTAPPPAHSDPAEQASAFSLRSLDGKSIKLSEFKGQPVVLDFWATWCAPCRAAMPDLGHMQERYQPQGLVVIGLSVDDGPAGGVRRFVDKLGVKFRVAMADEGVLDDYGPIRSIPTTIFINRKGEIVRRVTGYLDAETMDGFVQEILPR
jgi:thiol-disulfide isomerase/thioredoxin